MAQKLFWEASDFSADFTASPHHRSPDRKARADQLAECTGGVNVQAPVDVDAPDFSSGPLGASEGVAIHTDKGTVDSDFAVVTNPRFLDCTRSGLVRLLGAKGQQPGTTVEVVARPTPANTPPYTVAFRATVTRDNALLLTADGVLLGAGRTEITMAFTSQGGTFPDQLESDLVGRVAARLAANPT